MLTAQRFSSRYSTDTDGAVDGGAQGLPSRFIMAEIGRSAEPERVLREHLLAGSLKFNLDSSSVYVRCAASWNVVSRLQPQSAARGSHFWMYVRKRDGGQPAGRG